ncbi:MAG: hypothetical protein WBV82_26765 [Myxococcaceae bacterium]
MSAQTTESIYPVLESFVEHASPEEVARLFDGVKDGLGALKGPRAEQAKKVQVALERTEELLSHLMQVREKLEVERKSGARSR